MLINLLQDPPLLGHTNPIHHNLVSKLRMCGAVDLFTIRVFMAWKGKNVRFSLYRPPTPVSSNWYRPFPF